LGDQAQDGRGPLQPGRAEHGPVVPGPPAPRARRAAAEAERKATWSLRVLRGDGQLRGLVEVPVGGSAALAEVALPPQPHALDELGPFPAPPPALPAGRRAHRAFGLPARSEPVICRTVCSNASTYGSVGASGRQRPEATRSDPSKTATQTQPGGHDGRTKTR